MARTFSQAPAEDDMQVYAIRIKGNTFQPKVFAKGTYTVIVDDGQRNHLKGLESGPKDQVGKRSLQ